MRLTLRTLLAYMDDILDPADQEELGRKIESSAFATELIHRSRDAVRRLRLSAPDPLAGDSDGVLENEAPLDANTVSEYLDNTLSPDEVAEFERSCLEAGPHADMLLAEAASCHHVLTMVLGEPAEVDAELRQRMYAIAEQHSAKLGAPHGGHKARIEPAHVASAHLAPEQKPVEAISAVAPAIARGSAVDPDEAAAPDYILAAAKDRRRKRRFATAAILFGLLMGGGATWLFWPQGEVKVSDEVAKGIGNVDESGDLELSTPTGASESTTTAESAGPAGGEAPPFEAGATSEAPPFAAAPPAADAGAATDAGAAPAPPTAAETATEPPQLPPEVDVSATALAGAESPAPPAPPAGVAAPDAAAAGAEGPSLAGPPLVPPQAGAGGVVPPDVPPGDAASGPGAAGLEPGPLAAVGPASASIPAPGAGPGDIPPQDPASVADAAAPPAPGPLADSAADAPAPPATAGAAPQQIGAFIDGDKLLLRFDPAGSEWVRLKRGWPLTIGDRLLSLPTFRTHVVLGDANVHLAGGAEIDIVAPAPPDGGEPAELGIVVPYGQLIFNSGLKGNRVEFNLAGEMRLVTLAPSSSLAIEVRRIFEPGSGPNREPAPAEISWYLTTGSVEWNAATGGGSAEAPAMWGTAGGQDSTPAAVEELPEWIDRESMSDIERRAHETVADALAPGEPVGLRLLELSDPSDLGRRTEVFALAAECATYVGQFDPVVKSLGDVKQRANWKKHIEALRQAIARDPAMVEAIHASFAGQRGDEAADELTEMVLGFDAAAIGATPAAIKEGALLRLVRWLDNDDLTYRVLASYNVNEITGTRDFGGYRPEQSASQRDIAVKRYLDRLDEGGLKPKEAP